MRVTTAIDSRRAPGQEGRRRAEHAVRKHALAYLRASRGVTVAAVAGELCLGASTLAGWRGGWGARRMSPANRGPWPGRATREEVLVLLALVAMAGRRIGWQSVQLFVPGLPRAEVCRWLRHWRREWRRAHELGLMVLTWTRPGAVWALDYSEAETWIEGRYRYLLNVRDLSSGRQLYSQPCEGETEAMALAALRELIAQWGAPLVVKMDNGSAFTAGALRALLAEHGVIALYSPPYTPRYNGACEAGHGGLKTRVRLFAALAGRPGEWTCEDVERARCAGNDHGRPFGRRRPTPDAAWAERVAPTEAEREALHDAVRRHLEALRASRTSEPGRSRLALEQRTAIARALAELGYLQFNTRSIPPAIPALFSPEIR